MIQNSESFLSQIIRRVLCAILAVFFVKPYLYDQGVHKEHNENSTKDTTITQSGIKIRLQYRIKMN
jgi:hypothetical protein